MKAWKTSETAVSEMTALVPYLISHGCASSPSRATAVGVPVGTVSSAANGGDQSLTLASRGSSSVLVASAST